MKQKELYTIVHNSNTKHYDTNDECFYSDMWSRTKDTKSYLKMLIKNNPKKFEDCHIEKN